jgi:apolipoprotein N-acyltransferase
MVKVYLLLSVPIILKHYFKLWVFASLPVYLMIDYLFPSIQDFNFSLFYCDLFPFQSIISVFGAQVSDAVFIFSFPLGLDIFFNLSKLKKIEKHNLYNFLILFSILIISLIGSTFSNTQSIQSPKILFIQPLNAYPNSSNPYRDGLQLVSDLINDYNAKPNTTKPDLIVIPESTLNGYRYDCNELRNYDFGLNGQKSSMLINIDLFCNGNLHNAIVMIKGQESSFYIKKSLFPILEKFPGNYSYTAGVGEELLSLKQYNFSTPICNETTDQKRIITLAALQPDFFIESSSDSWFSDDFLDYAHLRISLIRSLETGIPIIRTTNSGISAILNPDGTNYSYPTDRGAYFINQELKTKNTLFPKIHTFMRWVLVPGLFLLFLFFLQREGKLKTIFQWLQEQWHR